MRYLAESAVEISHELIVNHLVEKSELFVAFEYDDIGETVLSVDSSPVYLAEAATDFEGINSEVEEIINNERVGTERISCEIRVINRTAEELKLHTLDLRGDLFDMDYGVIGELLPIEYAITVRYLDTRLESVFSVSGIGFELLDRISSNSGKIETLSIGLSDDNVSVTTTEFYYQPSTGTASL
jgi:hypothetical protein